MQHCQKKKQNKKKERSFCTFQAWYTNSRSELALLAYCPQVCGGERPYGSRLRGLSGPRQRRPITAQKQQTLWGRGSAGELIWVWGWINGGAGSGPSLMLKKSFHKRNTSGKRGNNNGWIWKSGLLGGGTLWLPVRTPFMSDIKERQHTVARRLALSPLKRLASLTLISLKSAAWPSRLSHGLAVSSLRADKSHFSLYFLPARGAVQASVSHGALLRRYPLFPTDGCNNRRSLRPN